MKVKELIKHLQKFDPSLKVGTFTDSRYDHTYTPISEIFVDEGVELAEEFRGKGVKRVEDWLLLVGPYQDWRYHTERGQLKAEISRLKAEALSCQRRIISLENKQNA